MAKIRLRTSNPTEVRRTLSRIVNMVANGEMEPKAANAIILACNAILSSEKLKEVEARTRNIEARTNVITGDESEVEDLEALDDEIYNQPVIEETFRDYPYPLPGDENSSEDQRTTCTEDPSWEGWSGEYGRLIRPEPGKDPFGCPEISGVEGAARSGSDLALKFL